MQRSSETDELVGVVYLIHFDEPLEHARHYIGFCDKLAGVDSRLEYHSKGRGSRLLAAVVERGIDFRIVRLWTGTRGDERRLKNRKNAPRLCPVCNPGAACPRGFDELEL